jgi:sterol desaturase/sphingolipid hydroxylase (fatty acid hydroxylase superfamily)
MRRPLMPPNAAEINIGRAGCRARRRGGRPLSDGTLTRSTTKSTRLTVDQSTLVGHMTQMDIASPDPARLMSDSVGRQPVRLFENDLLERLTRTSVVTLIVVCVPVFGLGLAAGLWLGHYSWLQSVVIIVAGALWWTLFEYLAHRFFFHLDRWVPRAQPLTFLFHGCHHVDPQDATRNLMPFLTIVPLFACHLAILMLLFGQSLALGLFGAIGLTYVAYDTIHYACHQWQPRGRIGRYIKTHHMIHHFRNDEVNFGVSSPLWDWIFGTHASR